MGWPRWVYRSSTYCNGPISTPSAQQHSLVPRPYLCIVYSYSDQEVTFILGTIKDVQIEPENAATPALGSLTTDVVKRSKRSEPLKACNCHLRQPSTALIRRVACNFTLEPFQFPDYVLHSTGHENMESW